MFLWYKGKGNGLQTSQATNYLQCDGAKCIFTLPLMGCQSITRLPPSIKFIVYPFIHGGERHCESKVSCLRTQSPWQGARFSKAPEAFRARKAKEKSRTLRFQSRFIHIFLI